MKVFGNTGKRYKKKGRASKAPKASETSAASEGAEERRTGRGRRVLRVFLIVLLCLGLLAGGGYAVFLLYIQPPDVARPTPVPEAQASTGPDDDEGVIAPDDDVEVPSGWRDGVYTFLVAGEDDEYGGTDVVMVGLLDTVNGELDVVSIPRDTVVNVPWGVKKINSYKNMYTYLEDDYDQYVDALIDGVAKLVGYEVDCWVTIDLQGFIELVDAIGGVEFDVPQRMYYVDPDQDLYIDLYAGEQTLYGQEAMQLVRFRGYTDGDIGRNQVQQDFLKALSSQLLRMQNLFKIDDMVQIFRDNVDTDMTLQNLGYFANEFLKLDSDSINFHAVGEEIANINDEVNEISYVSLYVDEWLELVNAYINPYTYDITVDDVEILTRDPETGGFYVTQGTYYSDWSY